MNFKQFLKNKIFGGLILAAFLALGFYIISLFLVKEQKEQKTDKEPLSASIVAPQTKEETKDSRPSTETKVNTSTATTSATTKNQVYLEGFEGLQEESEEIEKVPVL